jgi:hypothetical protein
MGVATGDFDNDGWVDLLTKFDATTSCSTTTATAFTDVARQRNGPPLVERVGIVCRHRS